MAAKMKANGSLVPPFRPQLGTSSSSGRGAREVEDPEIKAHLKAMAAKALWKLARGHLGVCKSITESRALLCFAVLLEKGDGGMGTNVQFFSGWCTTVSAWYHLFSEELPRWLPWQALHLELTADVHSVAHILDPR